MVKTLYERGDVRGALKQAQRALRDADLQRTLAAGTTHPAWVWHDVLAHPVWRIARSRALGAAAWVAVLRDTVSFPQGGPWVSLLIEQAPSDAPSWCRGEKELMRALLTHPERTVREWAVRSMGAAEADEIAPVPSRLDRWRDAFAKTLRQMRRLPLPDQDLEGAARALRAR